MKNLKELKGVKILNKSEQKAITGGYACIHPNHTCPPGSYCCLKVDRCTLIGDACF